MKEVKEQLPLGRKARIQLALAKRLSPIQTPEVYRIETQMQCKVG